MMIVLADLGRSLKSVMEHSSQENIKVEVKDTGRYGLGLFANEKILIGEVIADFSGGEVYEAEKCSDLPKEVADHAVQFEEHKWIDTEGVGRYSNHSCEPNCGVKDRFKIVAMRDIESGEELKWDYEMTEDSDWRMDCRCGTKSCRKVIGAYENMPRVVREKYRGYISEWLIKKYGE